MSNDALRAQLERHEGKRAFPYLDCCGKPWRACACAIKGKLTIGVGRNLDDVGLREDEIAYLLDNDIAEARAALVRALSWFSSLSEIRQRVLVDMAFNLGIAKLLTFSRTLADMAAGRHEQAAQDMLASRWAAQVKGRAQRLAQMWRTNTAD